MTERRIRITKMSGAGNDFLIADIRSSAQRDLLKDQFPQESLAGITQKLCHRHNGVGADGMVFLVEKSSPENPTHFRWEFFNADGSAAEMCGNAARCVARYSYANGITTEKPVFETTAGWVRSEVYENGQVAVEMPEIKGEKWQQKALIAQREIFYDWIQTGVPHAVLIKENLEPSLELRNLAGSLRNHSDLGSSGANVTFVKVLSSGQIASVSYERGVEDFTLACGTGAVAAARWYTKNHPNSPKLVQVSVPGGLLEIDLSNAQPILKGAANFIADLYIYPLD